MELSPGLADDPVAVEAAAKAFYEYQVNEAVKSIDERKTISLDRISSTAPHLEKESDRSCVILMYSLIDDLTKELILQECNQAIPGLKDRLFGPFGMLPTASNRFFLIFALEWISKEVFQNLNIIRKIRNRFAHDLSCNSFDCDTIKSYATSISHTHEEQLDRMLKAVVDFENSGMSQHQSDTVLSDYKARGRTFFMIETSLTMVDLLSQLCVIPEARRYRVHPSHLLEKSNLVGDLRKETIRLIFRVIEDRFKVPLKKNEPEL